MRLAVVLLEVFVILAPPSSTTSSTLASALSGGPWSRLKGVVKNAPLAQRLRKVASKRGQTRRLKDVSSVISRGSSVVSNVDEPGSKPAVEQWWPNNVEKRRRKIGTLILVRHGESHWNSNSTFTGWADVDLSSRGEMEMEHAARLLLGAGLKVDSVYTSRLKRAIRSSWILLKELYQIYRPVYKSWRLNERMYGSLTGLSKPQLALELGEDRVQRWRHGLHDRPPPMPADGSHAYWPARERKYNDLESIPRTESLYDTMERALPLWESHIVPELMAGSNVAVVAHGNSLRGIVKHIDNIADDDINTVRIPNGIPLIYKFERCKKNRNKLVPVKSDNAAPLLCGEFLEKKGLLREALARESELTWRVPGFDYNAYRTPIERALAKLDNERKLMELAGGLIALEETRDALSSPEPNAPMDAGYMLAGAPPTPLARSSGEEEEVKPLPKKKKRTASADVVGWQESSAAATERTAATPPLTAPNDNYFGAHHTKDPVLVIIRHGRTEHNKLGLFTGWEDAPLSEDGRLEAERAGNLLRQHGYLIDIVYTSWLSRAIETAWIVLTQLDCLWIPMVKTWRLNERMYGALTGLSKKMIQEQHGNEQFMLWRRSYETRPPPASSFSPLYPGNDERYVKYVRDVRYSVRESLVRSLASGKLHLEKKLPRSESLRDCMERTIPYFTDVIEPTLIGGDQKRNVLIASSENAIRGLLMHLCEIPSERISEVEIPTGLPIVFDVKRKCIRLLDDGHYDENPSKAIARHDFGAGSDLLFKPCTEDDEFCDPSGLFKEDPIIRLPEGADKPLPILETEKEKKKEDASKTAAAAAEAAEAAAALSSSSS